MLIFLASRDGRSYSYTALLAVFLSGFLLIALCGCSRKSAIAEEASTPMLTQAWRQFRDRYPLFHQALAVTRPGPDGLRALVISEPPPHVSLEQLARVAPDRILRLEVRIQPMGYDGWAKDIVAEVRANDQELEDLIRRLSLYLYGTDYKAYAYDLSQQGPTDSNLPAEDVVVTALDLERWLFGQAIPFLGADRKGLVSVKEILDNGHAGVFESVTPGLVAWLLPQTESIQDNRAWARRFVLDTDLILGAVQGTKGVLLVGRERQQAVQVAPPLRLETLELLDSVEEEELGQSYERRHPLAGHCAPDSDWAPIYLSPELVDTEYGGILDITDQMLKGWTRAGETRYLNFPYTDPPDYPFPKPLDQILKVSTLTFNWNTSGVGYILGRDGGDVYALNRTGALPVSYIPGEDAGVDDARLVASEDQAYAYYTERDDPYLIRVVQYAAFYQIARSMRADAPKGEVTKSEEPQVALAALTEDIFGKMQNMTMEERDGILRIARSEYGGAANQEAFAEVLDGIVTMMKESDDGAARLYELATEPSDPEELSQLVREVINLVARYHLAHRTLAASVQGSGWIHTPLVVQSWTLPSADVVGGHNLRAPVTRFRIDSAVERGSVRMSKLGRDVEVRVAPGDIGRIGRVVRTAGRQWKDIGMAQNAAGAAIRRVPVETARAPVEALRLSGPPLMGRDLIGRGFDFPDGEGLVRAGAWGHKRVAAPEWASGDRIENAVLVQRTDDGAYRVYSRGAKNGTEVYTHEDAVHTSMVEAARIGGERPVVIELEGLGAQDADVFTKNYRLRSTLDPRSTEVVATTRGQGRRLQISELRETRLDFGKAIVHEGIEVGADGHKAFTCSIEIPSRVAGRPSLRVRLQIWFSKMISSEAVAALRAHILSAVRTVLGASTDAVDLNLRLQRELREIRKIEGIHIEGIEHQVIHGASDISISHREPDARAPAHSQIDPARRGTAAPERNLGLSTKTQS